MSNRARASYTVAHEMSLFTGHHNQLKIANPATETTVLIMFVNNEPRPVLARTLDLDFDFIGKKNAEMAQSAMGVAFNFA